jgi:hypothetical protein
LTLEPAILTLIPALDVVPVALTEELPNLSLMALALVKAFALTLDAPERTAVPFTTVVARAFTDAAPSVANTSPTAYWYSQ